MKKNTGRIFFVLIILLVPFFSGGIMGQNTSEKLEPTGVSINADTKIPPKIFRDQEIIKLKFGHKARKWKKKFMILREGSAIQTVKSVNEENDLVLKNGAVIRILGIEFPQKNSAEEQCFFEYSHNFLTNFFSTYPKKILLEKPIFIQDFPHTPFVRNVFIFSLFRNKLEDIIPT